MKAKKVKSPCISKCHVQADVCQGCYRTYNEISNWSNSNSEEQEKILAAIKKRKSRTILKKTKR